MEIAILAWSGLRSVWALYRKLPNFFRSRICEKFLVSATHYKINLFLSSKILRFDRDRFQFFELGLRCCFYYFFLISGIEDR